MLRCRAVSFICEILRALWDSSDITLFESVEIFIDVGRAGAGVCLFSDSGCDGEVFVGLESVVCAEKYTVGV